MDAVQDLWRAFKEEGSKEARERLILYYAPLVKYVAGRVAASLARNVDPEDLTSYGVVGLIDAIEKFEPGRGVKFETYAVPRIKGAILDGMRSLDWAPRSLRARARELERAMVELEGRLQRLPTDEELASHMGLSVEELRQLYQDLTRASVVTLDEPVGLGQGEGLSLLDTLKDQRLSDVTAGMEAREVRDLVFRVLDELPERDKLVIALYYFEGLTLAEIGRVLGVTESRVSQIHSRAILQLRARLRPELES